MNPPRILVTRSEPGASETAERLAAAGYTPIVEPVFAVEPVAAAIPAFDALAFTSANGVRVFSGLDGRRDVPVFCVGGRTAAAAREAGYGDILSAQGDVQDLIRVAGDRLASGARLLHPGNEESRGDLSGALRKAGHDSGFIAIYRAAPVSAPGPVLAAHLSGASSFQAILVHSPRGASILAGFLAASPAAAPVAIAAISPAAAAPLRQYARRIEIAASPDEAALLSALSTL